MKALDDGHVRLVRQHFALLELLQLLPLGRGVSQHWHLHHLCSRRADLKNFSGIDWAEDHHDVALVNERGDLVALPRLPG